MGPVNTARDQQKNTSTRKRAKRTSQIVAIYSIRSLLLIAYTDNGILFHYFQLIRLFCFCIFLGCIWE